jgi:hypothetical protein
MKKDPRTGAHAAALSTACAIRTVQTESPSNV